MRGRIWLGLITFLIVGLLLVPRIILVPQVTRSLEEELQAVLAAHNVQVILGAPWGWELLFGHIPHLEVMAENAVVNDLELANIHISGRQIAFDFHSLWRTRQFVYQGAESLQGDVLITEGALNELVWQKVDPGRALTLQITPEDISLGGKVTFWGMELSLKIHGRLEVWQDSNLRFVPENLAVLEKKLPPFLVQTINEQYDFTLELGALPYFVKIKDIDLGTHELRMKMDVVL